MIKTYFIHLMDNQERKKNVHTQIEKHGLTDYKIMPAVPGKLFTPENNILGSLTSHNRVLSDVLKYGINNPVLVLEDDVVLLDGFLVNLIEKLVNLPADWDIAFIGYNLQGHNLFNTVIPGWFTSQGKHSPIMFSGGWAYLVNGQRAAKMMLPLMATYVAPNYPYHDFMLRDYIASGHIKAYWLSNRLVEHGHLPSVMNSADRYKEDFEN